MNLRAKFGGSPLPWLILFAAGALRLVLLLQNRSLFMDEASLALCLAEGSLADFFQPLDYHQYAPPLFLLLGKGSVWLAGAAEVPHRFWPFMASLAALYLLWRCCYLLNIRSSIAWYPLLLFGFSEMLFRYSTEFKPYSSDTFMALLAVWLCLKKPPAAWNGRVRAIWLALGVLGSWFSMPFVFVLAGVGAYYGYSFLKNKQRRAFLQTVWLVACWLLSFGGYYQMVLKTNLAFDPLAQYHQAYFFPLIPHSAADWQQDGELLLGIFKPAAGFTAWALIAGLLFWLLAFGKWLRDDPAMALLLGLPLLATLLASSLGYFSLLPRVSLFLVPLFILGIAQGASLLMEKMAKPAHLLLWLTCLLAVFPSLDHGRYFFQPYQIEELKPILSHLQPYRTLPVWLDHESGTVYRYYTEVHPKQAAYRLENVRLGKWNEQPVQWQLSLPTAQSFVLIYAHLLSEENRQRMDRELEAVRKGASVADTFEAKGAKAWVLEAGEALGTK